MRGGGPGNPSSLPKKGPGRPKGVKNKLPKDLKEMILQLAKKDNWALLKRIANEQPASFAALLGKVLPMEVSQDKSITVYVQGYDVERPEVIEHRPPIQLDPDMVEIVEFINE